jgi:hypothetical protein
MNNLICLHATTAHGVTQEVCPEGDLMSFESFCNSLRDLADWELISCWATQAQADELDEEYGIRGIA